MEHEGTLGAQQETPGDRVLLPCGHFLGAEAPSVCAGCWVEVGAKMKGKEGMRPEGWAGDLRAETWLMGGVSRGRAQSQKEQSLQSDGGTPGLMFLMS